MVHDSAFGTPDLWTTRETDLPKDGSQGLRGGGSLKRVLSTNVTPEGSGVINFHVPREER